MTTCILKHEFKAHAAPDSDTDNDMKTSPLSPQRGRTVALPTVLPTA